MDILHKEKHGILEQNRLYNICGYSQTKTK
jgi:hypothetical protein